MAAVPVVGLLAYIEQVGYLLARVPATAITIPTFPTWLGAAYYSALGPAVAAARSSGDRRKAGLVVAGLAPAAIALIYLALWANAPPQAVVMNVGDGQAILLRGPQGTILIDGGPSPAKLRDELGSQLPPWQSTLDAILITAPGLGHVGGFAGFDRPANTLVLPDAQLTGSAWRTAAFEAAARGASRVSSSRSSPPSQARPATRSAPPISPCAPSPRTGGVFATSAISMSRRKPSPRRG